MEAGAGMPWTVRVEDEAGKPDGEAFVVVEFGSLPKAMRFPISSLIEAAPYYDTVLNPVQVKALIEELKLSTLDGVIVHSDLLELAKRALEPHMYLRFIGD
jgi:hypothetical protein